MRPILVAFAEAQEEVLQANDYKGGWQRMNPFVLIGRLREEVNELEDAVAEHYHKGLPNSVLLKEACDVANFAMFIADVLGTLPDLKGAKL